MNKPKRTPDEFPRALHCNVCTYNWQTHRGRNTPRNCPNCNSRRWNWPPDVIKFQDVLKADRDRNRRAEAARKAS